MEIREKLIQSIEHALGKLGVSGVEVELEHPADFSHGDFSTNVALVAGKEASKNPKEFALELIQELALEQDTDIEKIEVAGPGFINFYLSEGFLVNSIETIAKDVDFGKGETLKGEKVLLEYTDPNPFKQFHIGHLMSNAIGESISRLLAFSGAEVKRANYQGDIGPHVAKAVWGMSQLKSEMPLETDSLSRKTEFLGNAYAHGATLYEEDMQIKTQIDDINIHLYKKDDDELNLLYEKGRKWSLEHFEELYKKLGTTFDFYFYESEVFEEGSRIVKEHLGKVFHESEGAIVFKGEDHGLHTRVFVTSKDTPTYEAKELGLHKKKAETYPYDRSIIITAHEQTGVFQVGLKAYEQIDEKAAQKTAHIAHGMLRLPSGKMSSRTGDVITGESLLVDLEKSVQEKIADLEYTDVEKQNIAEQVAVGAIKYEILKQSPGKDIIFDTEKALSFEGDSGPYLQYTHARAKALLHKAESAGFEPSKGVLSAQAEDLTKLLYRFPEVVERGAQEYASQAVTTFLIEVASRFNAYYAQEKIIDTDDKEGTQARLQLVQAVSIVLKNGLEVLAIPAPEKM